MATKTQSKTNSKAAAKGGTKKNTVVVSRKAAAKPKAADKSEDMPNSKFHKLFVDELKDIYWAEKNLVKALGKMQKAATSEELKAAIVEHQEVTQGQLERLDQVFASIGMEPKAKKCEAMAGLIAEAQEVIDDTDEDSAVRDAGIIICAQKVEHYEIAAYGSLRTLAALMQHNEAADLLAQTLSEEKEADSKLTEIAEASVNQEASAE
jgi:ferritin-like metal-binding protein YciE